MSFERKRGLAARWLVALLAMGVVGCQPPLTGIDGYWQTPWQDVPPLGVAIGQADGHGVWAADGFPFMFANIGIPASCKPEWKREASDLVFQGAMIDVEDGFVSQSDVTIAGDTATLTWKMSAAFAAQAKSSYLAAHPNADPSLEVDTEVTGTATLQDVDHLDLRTQTVPRNAKTGAPLLFEQWHFRLERVGFCSLQTPS